MQGIKLELIDKYNFLLKNAKSGSDDFIDDICNFIVSEFDLHASVMFRILGVHSFQVMGKSLNSKKSFTNGSLNNCDVCKQSNSNKIDIHTDAKCNLQITDLMLYECCTSMHISDDLNILIKLAKKTPFTQVDFDSILKMIEFIQNLILIWSINRGENIVTSGKPFAKIIDESTLELSNPVNSIKGLLSLLKDEKLNITQNEYVSAIKDSLKLLLKSIKDISTLSKFEQGKITTHKKSIVLKDFINSVIGLFKDSNENQFSVSIDKELSETITTDEEKLKFILCNILSLEDKLTHNGTIQVSIQPKSQNEIEFLVENSGTGLTYENQKNLFEPMGLNGIDELKNSNISSLGLVLTKKYIHLLGGNIHTEGIHAQGLKIKFSIIGDVMSTIESQLSQLPRPTTNKKVLVIEDDYATSKLLSNYLTKWGYEPRIVNNFDQIIELINSETFLAVILDIEIPEINGLQLLKSIKEHPSMKGTPVIVCSVEPDQQKAYMMGAVEYFVKPINYNYLVEVLTSYKLRKNSNILCVDDDLPTLNLLKQAIETAGFHSIAENYSKNVMELIKDKDLDLAIIDLDMPDINGFELIKLIKAEENFKKLPIIIYTGKENYSEDLKSIDGLFEDLLQKQSTNIEDLANTINSMINRYETPPPIKEVISKKNVVKILLAEDYKHSQIIVTRLLKKNNFENIVVVENGEEAVKMASKDKFDLILMDMQMPVMNGFEATEQLKQMSDYKDVPIIALTAFAMKGDREKCLEAGATDYIPKPIDSKEFIEKVIYYTSSK